MSTIENKIDDFVDLLNKYGHNDYISPVVMEDIIADKLNLSTIEIMEFVKSAKIVVTAEQIKAHLDKAFESEKPDLKKKIESKKDRKNILELSEEEMKNLSYDEFKEEIFALKYEFFPETLDYLEKYIKILRIKILQLLELIKRAKMNKLEQYENDNVKNIRVTLLHYGIKMNEDSDIHYQGFINLLSPLIYNVQKFKAVLEMANNLDTYFFFYISPGCLSERGFAGEEFFPTIELQIPDYKNDYMRGNIPLSDEQRNQLQQEYMKKFEEDEETIITETPNQYVKTDLNQ